MKYTESIARSMRTKIQKGIALEKVLEKTEQVLKEEGQYVFFAPALIRLKQLLKQDQQFETLNIEAPFLLAKEQVDKISQKVTGKQVELKEFKLNENLLAGFTARYKGKLYDGSARQYITKLAKQ
jgi:F0F1-type ATP synthase delta subunit